MPYQTIANFFSNHFVESCIIMFLLICASARIFNDVSGFKRLKKEREELQAAKDAFETYKLSIQSDRKKLDEDAASRLRTQQAQYAANEKRLAQQEAAMRQSLVHIRSSLRKTLLDDLRAFRPSHPCQKMTSSSAAPSPRICGYSLRLNFQPA